MYTRQVMNIPLFYDFSNIFKGNNGPVSWFDKKFIVGFFMDTVQASFFFKLWIIITLLGVYQIVSGLITLTLFHGHSVSES